MNSIIVINALIFFIPQYISTNAANLPAKLYTINHPHNTTHHFFSNKNQISKKVPKKWGAIYGFSINR